MNYRQATIFAAKDLGASGTEVIPITVKDIISRINILYHTTWGYDRMAYPSGACLEKIELVDGSDVLHSMDGPQNQALCIYDRRCPTMNEGVHIVGNKDKTLFGIDFGRFLFDPLLAFDPTRFRNTQLKITYDEDKSHSAATAGTLEVWADCFDEKIVNPIGFLMSKEHWSGAKPTSGYEYVELPTDYPIRKLLLQPYYAATTPWDIVDEARLDEDNEKRIPFDWDLEKYFNVMKGVWRPIEEPFVSQFSTEHPYYLTPTDYWVTILLFSNNVAAYAHGADKTHAGGYFLLTSSTGNLEEFQGVVRGYLPNHCIEFPFGMQDDPEDWYDVTKIGSVRLRLHAGTQDPTSVAVLLQQLRRY